MSENPTPEEIADIKRRGAAMHAAEEALIEELKVLVEDDKQEPEISST